MWTRTAVAELKTEETQTGLDTSVFLSVFLVVIVFNATFENQAQFIIVFDIILVTLSTFLKTGSYLLRDAVSFAWIILILYFTLLQ